MEFETVEHSGRLHVVKNGVESECFARPGYDGYWLVYCPSLRGQTPSLREAMEIITFGMDTWHTIPQAAIRLAELGAVAKPPVPQTMYRWLREGNFLGAIRCGPGRGGGWRISETALVEFTKKRR